MTSNKQNVTNILNQAQAQKNATINLDPSKLKNVKCILCNHTRYRELTEIKFVSKFESPNGKEGALNMKFLACDKCGWLFNLPEWKKKQEEKLKAKVEEGKKEEETKH